MIFVHRAPRKLPPFSVLVDDQGTRTPEKMQRLADYVGVSVRTFEAYISRDIAPRSVMMAMWWVSRWGTETIDTEIFNERRMLSGQVRCLQDLNANLTARVARLESLGSCGSANTPYFYPARVTLFNANGDSVTPSAVAFS